MKQGSAKVSGDMIIHRFRMVCKMSGRVFIPEGEHGAERMHQRGFSRRQVLEALGNFKPDGRPRMDEGYWKLRVKGFFRNEDTQKLALLRVVLVLKEDGNGDYVVVVTVFEPNTKRKR